MSVEGLFSMKEALRYSTIQASLDGQITVDDVSRRLGLCRRRVYTLRARVRDHGPAGVRHGNAGRDPANKKPESLRRHVVSLAKADYKGHNFTHIRDLLDEEHSIVLSDETVRRWLRPEGVGPQPRRGSTHRRRRKRREREGEMLFLDGSPHRWFGDDTEPVCLLLCSDDATGDPLYGVFTENENRNDVFRVCLETFTRYGLPLEFYLDRASWAKVTRHRPDDASEQDPCLSNFEVAMKTLGVRVIHAHSPQARGRGERLNGSFQGRLVAELVRHRIRDLEAATRFLNGKFIPRYKKWFSKPPANSGPAWQPLPQGRDLRRVLCARHQRVVANDNTIRFEGQVLQLLPPKNRVHLVRARLDIEIWFDGSIHAFHPAFGEVAMTTQGKNPVARSVAR